MMPCQSCASVSLTVAMALPRQSCADESGRSLWLCRTKAVRTVGTVAMAVPHQRCAEDSETVVMALPRQICADVSGR